MSKRPWYKRYPADFIAATMQLSLEEKGAYSIVLDLMYDKGGQIIDNSRYIARVCGCSTRRWNQIRERLIGDGKIVVDGDYLTNKRVKSELKISELEHKNLSTSGKKGAEKTNEKRAVSKNINGLDENPPHEGPSKNGRQEGRQRARDQIPDTREKNSVSDSSLRSESNTSSPLPRSKARLNPNQNPANPWATMTGPKWLDEHGRPCTEDGELLTMPAEPEPPPADWGQVLFGDCMLRFADAADTKPEKIRPLVGKWLKELGGKGNEQALVRIMDDAAQTPKANRVSWVMAKINRRRRARNEGAVL